MVSDKFQSSTRVREVNERLILSDNSLSVEDIFNN